MRSTCAFVAVVLSILMAASPIQASSPGAGQSAPPTHIAGQSVLEAAVQEHARATNRDRETVRLFLQRADVRGIAGKYGIDIRRAESAVAAMDASDVAHMAAQARAADEALAGGQGSVTISTTAIIIGLLVLILLIVALN
jgi:hypothetical protein